MMVVDRRGVKVPDRVPPCAVVTSLRARAVRVCAALLGCLLLSSCGNDPYRDADQTRKILYSSFTEAPRTLDPAVAYTTAAHVITANVFDSVLEYHYRKRPYELIAGLAEAVPAAEPGWMGGWPTGFVFATVCSFTTIRVSASMETGLRPGLCALRTLSSR